MPRLLVYSAAQNARNQRLAADTLVNSIPAAQRTLLHADQGDQACDQAQDPEREHACVYRKSDSAILVMKAVALRIDGNQRYSWMKNRRSLLVNWTRPRTLPCSTVS